MGDWAEWADWVMHFTQTQEHSISSFKAFEHVEKWKVFCFCLFATVLAQNKYFSISIAAINRLHLRIEKYFFVPHWSRRTEKRYFSIFNMPKSFEWGSGMPLCLCKMHSPSRPISPSQPISPIQPIYGEMGHSAAVAPRMGEKVTGAQLYLISTKAFLPSNEKQ